jgi:hypothetical protein
MTTTKIFLRLASTGTNGTVPILEMLHHEADCRCIYITCSEPFSLNDLMKEVFSDAQVNGSSRW